MISKTKKGQPLGWPFLLDTCMEIVAVVVAVITLVFYILLSVPYDPPDRRH